jgi:spermidine synthase/MFS family permease
MAFGRFRTYAGGQPPPAPTDTTGRRIMGSDTAAPAAATATTTATAPSPPLPLARLAGVGLIVFLANAALLVLQLVAGRLLAPFVGSSLETWTSVIGVFLVGIALGNGFGGRLADRYPSPRTLAILLAIGAAAALWMVVFPSALASTGAYKSLPLGPRIPLLALVLCLPAGFVLSLLTPLAIKLGLPDVSKTGRVAGMVFALSTLGCLLGNYLTGFVLIPAFTINTLVFVSAGALAALAALTLLMFNGASAGEASTPAEPPLNGTSDAMPPSTNPHAFADIRQAFLIVFLASFGGMTLELTASRVLAQSLGVSLFTWTGIIGVMLAGTALGNLTGGLVADRVNRPDSRVNPRSALACTLVLAGGGSVLLFVTKAVITNNAALAVMDPIRQVMVWTFSLFFLPMFVLGMVSPQVIRLAVPDVAHAGRVAGRVYAWSTAGAIVGTFAAGYALLSTLGMYNTILGVSLILTVTSLLVAKVWESNPMLYLFSIVLGGITGGFILTARSSRDADLIAQLETNYYTIKVTAGRDEYGRELRFLNLDHLLHSSVDVDDPRYLYYKHEHVQMEFLRGTRAENPNPRALVIGGGGYTFPRYAMEMLPETRMDVVEIDPGVTRVAHEHLGLKHYDGLNIVHMDGRQFVAERVAPGTYDLVVQDAVNDLSVPSHLMTKEYNDAVKKALKPGGVYLLTVIDSVGYGKLWKAAVHTLEQTYPAENIALLVPEDLDLSQRQVYVIYASDKPLDLPALQAAVVNQLRAAVRPESTLAPATRIAGLAGVGVPSGGLLHGVAIGAAAPAIADAWAPPFYTRRVPQDAIQPYLDAQPQIVLTDQYAPVDNLMADVFRYRYRARPK